MRLSEILDFLDGSVKVKGKIENDLEIRGLSYDSRKVEEGDLFVAISGTNFDGHQYISKAIENGARAVMAERYIDDIPSSIPYIICEDSRRTMAHLSSYWWGFPDRKLRLIGVTGTNGKTTTTHLIKWLFESQGIKTGLIGTINNFIGEEVLPATHTTPESWELFQLFAQMLDAGCESVVMEVSSHALKQGRVSYCKFDGVVFHQSYSGSSGLSSDI